MATYKQLHDELKNLISEIKNKQLELEIKVNKVISNQEVKSRG